VKTPEIKRLTVATNQTAEGVRRPQIKWNYGLTVFEMFSDGEPASGLQKCEQDCERQGIDA
jgi:hypothetical protein